MKRTPIRRVSKKRASANRVYSKLRKEYLIAHPWCQIYMKRFGVNEAVVLLHNGVYPEREPSGFLHWIRVPYATEIHHTNGRNGWRLNDVDHWLSACREQHEWVKENQSKARAIGVLI